MQPYRMINKKKSHLDTQDISEAQPATPIQKTPKNNQQILIVDDDPVFRHMLASYLYKSGYQVSQAPHGLDALKQLQHQVPDVILCDLNMPVMEGMDFIEEVSWQFPDLPLIVISATENMSDVAKVLRFGIKDFLTKPLKEFAHLTSAIQDSIAESENHHATRRDFSSQWFGVSEGQVAQEKELYWHIEQLKQTPDVARELLHALLPEQKSAQGNWLMQYQMLQSLERMPLIFDYAWLSHGRFAFYLLDVSSSPDQGVACALLVRALFNDFLRHDVNQLANVQDLAKQLEKGLECTKCEGVNALLGIADMTRRQITILPSGISALWRMDTDQQAKHHQPETVGGMDTMLPAGSKLGEKCHLTAPQVLMMGSANQLYLKQAGQGSFKMNLNLTA